MASINYAAREISVKIVYYGPGLSGKTTNLQIIHKKVPKDQRSDMVSLATETDRTLFFDFLPLNLGKIKGFDSKFQLYTVPGQVYYNATRKLVLRGVDGIVFVADSAEDKMNENIESYNNMIENLSEYGYKLTNIPVVLQYNKRDVPNAVSVDVLNQKLNPSKLSWNEAIAFKGKGVFESLKIIGKIVIDSLNKKYSGSRSSSKPGLSAGTAARPAAQRPQPSGNSLSNSMRPPSVSAGQTPKTTPPSGGNVSAGQQSPPNTVPDTPKTPGENQGPGIPIQKGYSNYMAEGSAPTERPQKPQNSGFQTNQQRDQGPAEKSSLDMELEKYESRLKGSGQNPPASKQYPPSRQNQPPLQNPGSPGPAQQNPFNAPGGNRQPLQRSGPDYNPFQTGQQNAGFNAPPADYQGQPGNSGSAGQQQHSHPSSGQFNQGTEYKQPPLPESGNYKQSGPSQNVNRDKSPLYFTSVDKNKKTKKHKRPVNPKAKQNKKGFFGKFFNRE